jgi:hypothetical protein
MGYTTEEVGFNSWQGKEILYSPHVQTGWGPLSILHNGYKGYFPVVKMAWAWCWPFISIYCQGGAILPIPHTSSQPGDSLIKPRDNFTFYHINPNHNSNKIVLWSITGKMSSDTNPEVIAVIFLVWNSPVYFQTESSNFLSTKSMIIQWFNALKILTEACITYCFCCENIFPRTSFICCPQVLATVLLIATERFSGFI